MRMNSGEYGVDVAEGALCVPSAKRRETDVQQEHLIGPYEPLNWDHIPSPLIISPRDYLGPIPNRIFRVPPSLSLSVSSYM